jgi:replicative DNA helicase
VRGRDDGKRGGRGGARREGHAAERLLLLLMLRDPPRIADAAVEVRTEDFRDAANRELFSALVAEHETGGAVPADRALSAAAHLRRQELLNDPVEITDGERSYRDAVADLQVRRLFLQLDDLALRMSRASDEESSVLMLEKQALSERLHSIDPSFKTSRRYRASASGGSGRGDAPTTEGE